MSAAITRRSPPAAAAADHRHTAPSRHQSVTVIIDDVTVSSDAATFSYVDDPVISDVISRDSILRSACIVSLLKPLHSAIYHS